MNYLAFTIKSCFMQSWLFSFVLCWSLFFNSGVVLSQCVNDEKTGAILVNDGVCFSNSLAFNQASRSSQAYSCYIFSGTNYDDIWFYFVASSPKTTVFANSNTGYAFALQVTDASDNLVSCGSGNLLNGTATQTANLTNLTPGATYYIRTSKGWSNLDKAMKVCVTAVIVNPTVSFANITKNYGDAPFTAAMSSNSSGLITYSITAGSDCATITSGGLVTILKAGTVTIQASQAAAPGYAAITSTSTLTINKIDPSLAYTGSLSGVVGGVLNLSASSLSTSVPTFSIQSGGTGQASLNGSTLSLQAAGTVEVLISLPEDVNYNSASLSKTITIANATSALDANFMSSKLTVYPNPSDDQFTITLNGMSSSVGRLAVYDLTGTLVYLLADGDLSKGDYQVSMKPFPAGMYLLRLDASEGSGVWKLFHR
jgi:hypothetical protein